MAKHSGNFSRKSRRASEAGQTTLFFVLVLGIFLLGGLCFAFDLSNMWFHRQAAQTAADAACTAGAMDLLVDAQGGATGNQGFTLGKAYSCATTSTDSVCKYAAKNGYSSNNAAPGNLVSVSFPGTVNGVTKPPAGIASTAFIRVDVLDNVQTFFVGLLSGGTTASVRAFATCGLELATAPIPMLVLDPQTADGATLSVQGTPTIAIYGGPQQSIQVDSGDPAAVNIGGSGSIDLSKGGPNTTGSNLGVYGGPATAPGGFSDGTTGHWVSPSSPISDPFAQMCAPGASGCSTINGYSVPAIPTTVQIPTDLTGTTKCNTAANIQAGNCTVPTGYDGCPAAAGGTCTLYTWGAYPGGISVKNDFAIFDPGLYYVTGGLALQANSNVYPGTGATSGAGDGSGGTVFYFVGSSSTSVAANSGGSTFSYSTSNLKCTASSTIPTNIPATITVGNILLGPCSGYYGDPLGTSDSLGEQRGILFFQDRSATGVTAGWGGGGQFALVGTMYIHACIGAGGAGVGCTQTASTKDSLDTFSFGGNSGSGSYVWGEIIADQIQLSGTPSITMDLDPAAVYTTLKASLLQ
jgi:hypothetical protein